MSYVVSIIVVSYNTRDLLRDCLSSAIRESRRCEAEIWVVDNASTDGSAEVVERDFPQIHLIRNEENRGFAKANNQAMCQTGGRYLLLLNADAALLPGSLSAMLDSLTEHSEVGICGPCLVNPDGSLQPCWGAFPTPWTEFSFQTFLFKVWPGRFPYGRRVHPLLRPSYCRFRLVDWVTGACLMLKREVMEEVGTLPEQTFMYGEDLEYCLQARKAGFEVALAAKARVLHHLQAASRADYEKWIENYTLGTLCYHARHGTPAELRLVSLLILLGSKLRQGVWRLVGLLCPRRRAEVQARCRGYRRATALARGRLCR